MYHLHKIRRHIASVRLLNDSLTRIARNLENSPDLSRAIIERTVLINSHLTDALVRVNKISLKYKKCQK